MGDWTQPAPLVVVGTVVLALLVLLATFVVCVAARARTRGAVWPLPVVVGAIAAPMLAMAWAVRRVAADFGRALSATDASEAAMGLAGAISESMHSTTPFLMGEQVLIALGTSIVMVSVARGWSRLSWLAVIAAAAGLEVLLYGGLGYVHGLVEAFQAVATADPADKKDLLLAAMIEAQGAFHTWISAAGALGALGGLLAMVAAARRAGADVPSGGEATPAGAAAGSAVGGEPSPGVLVLLAVLGLAGIAASVPALREAEVVLPPSARLPVPDALETPALEGPDRVRQAPVIALEHTGRVTLEGFAMERASLLGERLAELRQVEEMMRPGARRSTRLTLAVDRRTRGAQLRELLVVLSAEGTAELQLVFVSTTQIARPLLGSTAVTQVSAVDVSIATDAPGPVVSFTEAQTFAELAPEVVKRRAAGVTPVLALAMPGL
jgi:hypothetical protein